MSDLDSLLKDSRGGRFHPRSGPKWHRTRRLWGVSSPICGRYQLNVNFFNKQ
jgi:hypothetical protein